MSRWPKVPLGEVLRLYQEPHDVDIERSYPNAGILNNGRGMFRRQDISGATRSASVLYRIAKGDFIYSRLKAFEGAYTVVPDELDGCFVSNEFPTFKCDPKRLLPGFLRWYFKQPSVWKALAVESKGMGNRRERLRPDRIVEFPIGLPPLDEQRRIVAQLDAIAARIADRTDATTKAGDELAVTLRNAFKKITNGVPHRPMAEIAPLVRRPVEIDLDSEYPELGVRSFGRGTFHKPPLPGGEVGTKKLFEIHTDDLVFNIVFAWEGAVAVASHADHGRFGSHRFLTCVPISEHATSCFLRFFFSTSEGLKLLDKASPGGAGRNRTLGLKALEAIKVPGPSLDAQHWFDSLQAKVGAVRTAQAEVSSELDLLIPSLLHHAFA
jgi:type I restriction enzyme S subunit